ncbi:Regulator of competence-specific genes [Mannheimia haemolytica]|uniref:Regulator of competence-specific genes n=1 Tax=Mannheimia haemolytica TaxID=75985 RepID=A0A3S5B1G6_MANHA|nr:TfoX/Sxy family protein [Mannheimia haemolytica]MDO4431512.1 TfoX/Sxy family protein [Lonepinella koalarum]MDO4431629.1 TfoX/Sxy family protein [Lonepinella koalarum]VEI74934.1 Regulator of competence-specific genes [Mannheimia haemolytica]
MSEFCDFIVEQLHPLAPINVKRMFGCWGLFRYGKMFAIIDDDLLYIKVDEKSKPLFIQEGCEPFRYFTTRKGVRTQVALNYYQLPETALDNSDELCYWARLGISAG